MSVDLGLTLDAYSWPLYAAMLSIWLWSLRFIPNRRRLGWQAVPMSLFGLAWMGFFLDFILRFPLLCWDSFIFGNMTSRLAEAVPDKVNLALILAGLYWLCVTCACTLAARSRIANPMSCISDLSIQNGSKISMFLALTSTACVILTSGYMDMPASLITPLGIVARFWMLPAGLAWWDHFHGIQGRTAMLRWVLLLPGVLHGILSPYRENFAMVLGVVFIAAFYANRRYRLASIASLCVILFLAGTVFVGAYRQVLWDRKGLSETVARAEVGYTLHKSYDAKWVEALRRFHGFDSLLLTTRFVPEILAPSERTVFTDALARGLLPRAIFSKKVQNSRGQEFATSIWGTSTKDTQEAASIAPTMAGDLFEAGGILYVIMGGLCWGLLLGILERWRLTLPPDAAGAFTAMLALHCVASVERDFAHVIAATIQFLVLLFLVSKFLAPRRLPRPLQPIALELPAQPNI